MLCYMPVNRLTNGDPFAVDIRPDCEVAVQLEGLEVINIEFRNPHSPAVHLVLTMDTAVRMLLELHPALLMARYDPEPHI